MASAARTYSEQDGPVLGVTRLVDEGRVAEQARPEAAARRGVVVLAAAESRAPSRPALRVLRERHVVSQERSRRGCVHTDVPGLAVALPAREACFGDGDARDDVRGAEEAR
jgi:hypothetical protein